MYEKMNSEITLNEAVSVFSRGKKGTIGIIRQEDGTIVCQGLGCNSRVADLVVTVNGKCFDRETFAHRIIARKKRDMKPEWAVVFSEDETYCATSGDEVFDFCCIAFVQPSPFQRQIAPCGAEKLPVIVKMRFRGDYGAIVVLHGQEFLDLAILEAREIMEKEKLVSISTVDKGGETCDNSGAYQEGALVEVGDD